jgi:flagellar basal body-associated protein FliL
MKVKLPDNLVDDIRQTIEKTRATLVHNKVQRKAIMAEIARVKNNIRTGEALCSKLEVGLVAEVAYLREDLQKKREALKNLRIQLITSETHHAISKSHNRVLHEILDKLKQPLNPEAVRRTPS